MLHDNNHKLMFIEMTYMAHRISRLNLGSSSAPLPWRELFPGLAGAISDAGARSDAGADFSAASGGRFARRELATRYPHLQRPDTQTPLPRQWSWGVSPKIPSLQNVI